MRQIRTIGHHKAMRNVCER